MNSFALIVGAKIISDKKNVLSVKILILITLHYSEGSADKMCLK